MGIEPTTFCLASKRTTAVLLPLNHKTLVFKTIPFRGPQKFIHSQAKQSNDSLKLEPKAPKIRE